MKYLFFILLPVSSLFASLATTENDPESLIEGIVSAATGELYLHEEDLNVAAYQPISIARTFLSSKGQWEFWNHATLTYYNSAVGRGIIVLPERNGSIIQYFPKKVDPNNKEIAFFTPPFASTSLTNTSRGEISGRTNLRNQYLMVDYYDKVIICFAPDGTRRFYKFIKEFIRDDDDIFKFADIYKLVREDFVNGSSLHYIRNDDDDAALLEIQSKSPSGEIYGRIQVYEPKIPIYGEKKFLRKRKIESYKRDKSSLVGSDGSQVDYLNEKTEEGIYTIVQSNRSPYQKITYRNGQIETITFQDGRVLNIRYSNDKVKEIYAPVGDDGTLQRLYSFHYHGYYTKVLDAYDVPTYYHFDDKGRLIKVERYRDKEHRYNTSLFKWSDEGYLLKKTLLDEDDKTLHEISYTYDRLGNVLEEVYTSDDTNYKKSFTYTDDGKNLPRTIKEDNGKEIRYTYFKNTNLPERIETLVNGETEDLQLFHYDKNHVLIREESIGKSNVVKEITPLTEGPYKGMPAVVVESSQGRPIKKKELFYTKFGNISNEHIYDSDGVHRYSLSHDYDE